MAQYAGPAALAGGAVLGSTMLADRGIEERRADQRRTEKHRHRGQYRRGVGAVAGARCREPGYYKDRQENMRVEPLLGAMDSDPSYA